MFFFSVKKILNFQKPNPRNFPLSLSLSLTLSLSLSHPGRAKGGRQHSRATTHAAALSREQQPAAARSAGAALSRAPAAAQAAGRPESEGGESSVD